MFKFKKVTSNCNCGDIADIVMGRKHIVAYGPVTKQWLYKQRPLLGDTRNIHVYACNNRRTAVSVHQIDCWKRCFLLGPCKGVLLQIVEAT
jgi:hypothetical protein